MPSRFLSSLPSSYPKTHFPKLNVYLRSRPDNPWIFNNLVCANSINSMRAVALLQQKIILRKHYKTSIKLAKKGPQKLVFNFKVEIHIFSIRWRFRENMNFHGSP